jgi:hypothetical protein
MYTVNDANLPWLKNVHNIINECGLAYIWNTQTFINSDVFISLVKQTLKDQYNQLWHSQTENSTKALTCRFFKDNFMPEPYLEILDSKNAIILCKFRTTNHRLPIEIGRWQNIERNNRKCLLCDTNTIGDEFHYILQCRYSEQNRKKLIPSHFRNRPNVLKFKNIMTVTKKSDLLKLCKMIKVINEGVCAPG